MNVVRSDMKNFCSILAIFFIGLTSSCTTFEAKNPIGKPKVLCTTQMIADQVKNIVEDTLSIDVLIQGEIDPHSYQIVKGDAEKISEASILFANGLNLEHGSSLKAAIQSHANAILIGDLVYENHPEEILVVDGELDPHIWMDVSIWSKTIDYITQALIEAFPENKNLYLENTKKLKIGLNALDDEMYEKLQKIPEEKRYLVTSHDAFNYFSRRYLATKDELNKGTWSKRFKAPEGLSPDGQIGTYDIKKILDHLKEHRIAVVFPESNVSIDSLRKIQSVAKSQGVKIVFAKEPLFGDSMSGESLSVKTYQEMMRHNCEIISHYLDSYHPV